MTRRSRGAQRVEDNSVLAILRFAVAVAVADGEFDEAESSRIEAVYRDVCSSLGHDDMSTWRFQEFEVAVLEAQEEAQGAVDEGQIAEYVEQCADSINDTDIRELAVLAALRIAGGDHKLATEEASTLLKVCSHWGIRLRDIVKPYLDIAASKRRDVPE